MVAVQVARTALVVALLTLGGCASAPRNAEWIIKPAPHVLTPEEREDAEVALCEDLDTMRLWNCPTKT